LTRYVTLDKLSEFSQGAIRAFRLGEKEVAVTKIDGAYYAFDNECTHAQQPLAHGYIRPKAKEVVCVFHWAVFYLPTGQVHEGPAPHRLGTYEVRTEGDELQIQWEDELPDGGAVPVHSWDVRQAQPRLLPYLPTS
jgi:3-phenylpropionate/trans-cinnamate dioxygenase ferredoxin subunit